MSPKATARSQELRGRRSAKVPSRRDSTMSRARRSTVVFSGRFAPCPEASPPFVLEAAEELLGLCGKAADRAPIAGDARSGQLSRAVMRRGAFVCSARKRSKRRLPQPRSRMVRGAPESPALSSGTRAAWLGKGPCTASWAVMSSQAFSQPCQGACLVAENEAASRA